MPLKLSALLLISYAVPVLADQVVLELPKGQVVFTLEDYQASFVAGDRELVFDSGYMPKTYEVWKNSALVFFATGGSACAGDFAWITLDEKGLRATETFGTCSDLPTIEKADDKVTVSMSRLDGGTAGYLFDGEELVEIELGLQSAGVAEPGRAEAWAGRAAYDVLTSAEMEPVLLGLLSWEELEDFRISSAISSDVMERDGDWYVATGCRPHACDEERAGIALSTKDGRPVLAYWRKAQGGSVIGEPNSALPNKLRRLLSGR